MPSERVQRRINALLDEADSAVGDGDWERVRERARDVLAFAEDDAEARAFLDAAERRLGSTDDLSRQPSGPRRRRSRAQGSGEDSGRGERRDSLALGFRQLREFVAEERKREPSPRPGRPGRGLRAAAGGRAITILFTDMRGSTPLTVRLGDEQAHRVVRQHNQSVREALATQRGREIKHTGDGIMASFLSASGAVECALEIQRRIGGRGEQEPPALQVRIGINAGEAIADDED